MRYWTDRVFYFGTRATSRVEVAHEILKKDLEISRGDFKDVIRKFQLILNRIYDEVTAKYYQESRKLVQRFNIKLFEFI